MKHVESTTIVVRDRAGSSRLVSARPLRRSTAILMGMVLWDCIDLNTLSQAIASGSVDQLYDLNGDGLLSFLDVADESAGWLAIAGPQNPLLTGGSHFALGDANLDGLVDGSDFNHWNANKFTAIGLYCSGDFNVDGTIDETDWEIWNAHKFTASAATIAAKPSLVPEPTISGGLLWLIVTFALRKVIRKPGL